MEQESAFEEIKNIYITALHFSEGLFDYLSNEEILTTCVEGRANIYISNRFSLEMETVETIIKTYLGFTGWKHDLDFSPYDLYNASDKFMEDYVFNCYMLFPNASHQLILTTYFICRVFDEIKERMDNEYYRT